jgi:hypothetical protein
MLPEVLAEPGGVFRGLRRVTLGTMIAGEPVGTLGGSALASWTPFWGLIGVFLAINVVLFAVGRSAERPWPLLQPLSRIPSGLTRLTRIPGWAAVAIGMALFGLLVAGQGFYSDVSWHIALGRDDDLFTAPHAGILLGLVMILGGAVLGTLVATFDGVDGWSIGALRVPRSLVPLWALGLGAVSGFPLDEIWHRAYGVDVTMWSPTHMLMILGATFTGLAAWLILAESGVRPTDSAWGRGAHVVCGWLTIQGLLAPMGEFTFGVPQFSLLFAPILVSLAAGLGLVAFRLVHGAWWTLGLVVVNFVLQVSGFVDFGGGEDPVDTRFGATFLASAVVIELAARLVGTADRTRFALVAGLGIGTIGLAGEWWWNQDAWQRWSSGLLPEAAVLAVIGALGAAVLGAAFARAIDGDARSRAVPGGAIALAALACLAVIVLPMRRPTGDVTADVRIEDAGRGEAVIVATLTPADAAADAYWFQASAWQGGGLELADMEPTGRPGEFRSDGAVPVDGLWKTLLRLHRGAEMMAVPVYLPADPDIDEPEIPAEDRVAPFEPERDYLLRETHDGNAWLSPAVHLLLVAVCATWAAAFVLAVRHGAGRGGDPTTRGRRSVAAAAGSGAATAAAAAGPAAPPSPA